MTSQGPRVPGLVVTGFLHELAVFQLLWIPGSWRQLALGPGKSGVGTLTGRWCRAVLHGPLSTDPQHTQQRGSVGECISTSTQATDDRSLN